MRGNFETIVANFKIHDIKKRDIGVVVWQQLAKRNTVMYSYETSHFVPPPAPQRRANALQVDCGVPTFAGPALNFEIKALAPLVFPS